MLVHPFQLQTGRGKPSSYIGNGQKAVKIPSHTQDGQLNNSVLSQCLIRPVFDLPTRTYIGLNLVRNP